MGHGVSVDSDGVVVLLWCWESRPECLRLYRSRRDAYIQGILGAWFPWFISTTLYFAYKYIYGTKLIKAIDADLDTGRFIPSDSDKEDMIPYGPRWKRILKLFV
jgi:lysine-specific permease